MFVISKLFTYIFLPPGIFIWILILAGFFSKKIKWLFFISAFFLYLISITPVTNLLLSPLEKFKHKDNITPTAVVVLGGGVVKNDVIHAAPDAFKRLMYAMIVAKKNNLPLIFSGGGIINESTLIQKDIKLFSSNCNCKLKTYFENKSLNTYQNAKFTSALFEKLNLKKEIFLVTSAYHMKRAYLLFKQEGFKIITKPVDFKRKTVINFLDFLPNMHNFYNSYKAIHEYFGILSIKIRKPPQ